MISEATRRIAFVVQELTLGGAAWFAIRLMRRLATHCSIDVFVTGRCAPEMVERVPSGVNLYRMPARGGARQTVSGERSALAGLTWAASTGDWPPCHRRYDVLLSTSVLQDWRSCITHAMIGAERKFLFLVDETLANYPDLPAGRQSAIDLAIEASSSVVAVSDSLHRAMRDACPPLGTKPLTVLPPLIDDALPEAPARAPARPHTPLTILTIARLTAGKRVLDCLRAHHALIQEGLDVAWHVVGEGTEHDAISAGIARLDVGSSFTLHPPQAAITDWLTRADVLVLFSDSEGCPTVVLEALHVGCPVITTAVHGVDRFVHHRENGLIVPTTINGLIEALREFATDARLRTSLRNAAATSGVRRKVDQAYTEFAALLEQDPPTIDDSPPRVSILIPTFNQAHCIDKAISSALMQDFPALEVVVIDDHSSDDTQRVCGAWLHDPRFRYVRNPHNLGRVANYHQALHELARGDWVVMLDGDDYLTDAGFISTAWRLVEAHADQNIVFLQAGHTCHHQDGSRPDTPILPDIDAPFRRMDGGDYLKLVYDTGFFTHLGLFYNRRVAIEHDAYRAEISSSDMESFLRIALAGRIILMASSVGRWTQHGANASSNLPAERVAENVRIFRTIAEQAIGAGLVRRGEIAPALNRFQAHTLAYLYRRALEREREHPQPLTDLLRMIVSIHPALLLNRRVCRLLFDIVARKLRQVLR